MSAGERRELVLAAATRCFARAGFAGTSTDTVAQEAEVSQPYVVRIFGTKHQLFLEAFERAGTSIRDAFAEVVAAGFDPSSEEDRERLGAAYGELLVDRDRMLLLLHGFAAGDDDEIGARARAVMGQIASLLRGTGMSGEEVRDFIAQGMLLTVLMAMRGPQHLGEEAGMADLVECAFGDALSLVRE
jgi:AcrR family transcriptional regulator